MNWGISHYRYNDDESNCIDNLFWKNLEYRDCLTKIAAELKKDPVNWAMIDNIVHHCLAGEDE